MRICLFSLLLLSGCQTSRTLSGALGHPVSSSNSLIEHTQSLGLAWPLQVAGLATMLTGLALFVLHRRTGGLMLLGTGVLLVTLPSWILETFHQITWLGSAALGSLIVMGVVWVAHRLWKYLKLRKERIR